VTTGEEEENVLFSERSFLYRFVADTKEWKEKGRGEMKILEHKTTGRKRLLMRREQVLKVCCNHVITASLALKPLQTSDRTWTWTAQDFSEGERTQEMFALKFKTLEQAQKFKKIFEEAQTKEKPKEVAKPETEMKSLFDQFKPKEGSWECGGCFIRNPAEVTKCLACETLKPGTTAPATSGPTLKSSGFKFGTSPF
jgi:E3 SUMO-protein ligase RanBP2